jgi:hypothetical protein
LFFFQKELSEEQLREATLRLTARWAVCVRNELGADFAPNEHGVDLQPSHRSDYLIKSVWELVEPGSKRGRGKNRTPLQIAASAANARKPTDVSLWVSYCDGMRGAKMLTWSRGLRAALGISAEKSDQVVVEGEEQPEAETVVVIDGYAWDRIRDRRGLACAILEVAELAVGQKAGFDAVLELARARGRPQSAGHEQSALLESEP